MAAVYLHNASFSQNNQAPHDIQEHSRNISTISSATLATNTTLHSQPTEPLLNTNTYQAAPDTNTHFPPTFPPPQNSAGLAARLHWGDPPDFNTQSSLDEKNQWKGALRRSARRRKTATLLLEILIVAWCIYTTVRYFIAFTIYDRNTPTGREFNFALGTSSGLAFALIVCSHGLFFVKDKLSVNAFRHLTRTRLALRYISSLLILGPAIVNFVLIFLWRNSSNPRHNLHNRCHRVSVDIVWSVPRNPCSSRTSPWGVWVTLSSIRLVVTSIILFAYHFLSYVLPICPEPPLHHRLRSESYPSTALTSDDRTSSAAVTFPITPVRNRELSTKCQDSDSTLKDSYRPPGRLGRTRSQSSGMSDETIPGKSLPLGQGPSPPESAIERQDHFQSLLSQINQETEDAMNFASSERTASPATSREQGPSPTPSPSHPPGLQSSYFTGDALYESSDDDNDYEQFHVNHDNIYNLPPVPPVLGYNEFGMPYPPDQDMRILNGYIRRMPTIESMGSGEIAMSGASNRLGGSMYTSSRPPTRNTLLSFTSSMDHDMSASTPPSRRNSLSARAELLVGMSAMNTNGTTEHGELRGRHEVTTKRLSNPVSFVEYPDSVDGVTGDTYSSGGSRASYHTATMGSTGDALPSASTSLHPSSATKGPEQ